MLSPYAEERQTGTFQKKEANESHNVDVAVSTHNESRQGPTEADERTTAANDGRAEEGEDEHTSG